MVGVMVSPYKKLSGIIMQWSGSIATIPYGWVICDGNNGTPDLTDRFVIHADADAAGTRNVGDIGGEQTHELSLAEIPAHNHTQRGVNTTTNGETGSMGANTANTVSLGDTLAAGGNNPHQNMPKFYSLAYIMKT